MRKADLDKKNRSSMKIRKAMRKGLSTALATAMVVGSVNFTAPTNVYGEETGALVPVEQEKKSEDDAQENAASNTEANAVSDAEEVKDATADAEVNEEADSNEADVAADTEDADAEASEDEADAEQSAEIADSEAQIEIAALEPQAVSESAIQPVMTSVATTFAAAQPVSYKDFTEDEVVADLKFGSDVTENSLFETSGQGFSTVEFKDEAKGWSGNVYYPRVATTTDGNAAYVKAANGSLAISSKVWTETESTGYGVYTYENTSTYEMSLPAADYMVEVTFVNPTDTSYTAYAEAEEIPF